MQYQELAEAMAQGQVSLLAEPPEELSGMDSLLIDQHTILFSLLCKLEGLLILDEDSGKYERIALFERNSPYQKRYKEIVFEEFDSLSEIADMIEKDYNENKNFYKVRIMAKKFMIEKVREIFKNLKHCVILDIVNLTFKDTYVQTMNVGAVVKENLDKGSVSANCLEYCKKALNEPRLEDLLCSTYATLEGTVELNKEED